MPILDRRTNQFVEDIDSRVSVGIDFPLGRVPNGDGYFKTTKTTIDAIKTNIKLLLKTNQGERLFQPNLGMNLQDIIFEQITEDSIVRIENNILDVFERWLPFVELRNIDIQNKDDLNQVNINIEFNIKRTPNSLENVNVTFGGGGVSTGAGASSEGNISGGTGGY